MNRLTNRIELINSKLSKYTDLVEQTKTEKRKTQFLNIIFKLQQRLSVAEQKLAKLNQKNNYKQNNTQSDCEICHKNYKKILTHKKSKYHLTRQQSVNSGDTAIPIVKRKKQPQQSNCQKTKTQRKTVIRKETIGQKLQKKSNESALKVFDKSLKDYQFFGNNKYNEQILSIQQQIQTIFQTALKLATTNKFIWENQESKQTHMRAFVLYKAKCGFILTQENVYSNQNQQLQSVNGYHIIVLRSVSGENYVIQLE